MSTQRYVSGQFTGAADSELAYFSYPTEFSLAAISLLFASTGSVTLQRRVDGTNWRTATDKDGNAYTWTTNREANVEVVPGACYRLHCTAAGGAIDYFFGSPRG